MNGNVLKKDFSKDEEKWLWDWPFENKELLKDPRLIRSINQKELLNKINHLHFIGESFQVFFQDIQNQKRMLFRIKIKSCSETAITCICKDKTFHDINTLGYQMTHIAMDDGKNLILMPACLQSRKNNSFTIHLPDVGYEINQRQVRRYLCHNINVKLSQDGLEHNGMLLDSSSFHCRVQLKPATIFNFKKDFPINISFFRDHKPLYSAICLFTRDNDHSPANELVLNFVRDLKPIISEKRQLRNPRLNLRPSPSITYLHPIIQKQFRLEIQNISSSGFCVFENADESVLMKNMVINNLVINFTDTFKIHCSAKVANCLPETQGLIQCGIVILDMVIRDYNLLNKMLVHSLDSYSNINHAVDMESLWKFFFNGNFIYPQKYHHIQSFRQELKNIYQSLYQETPSIANHFIYQKNGMIYGHISMLRAYEKCWLLHHHIAKVMDNKPVGFLLLKQMMHYFMDMHRLPSLKTDYIMACFRPENKFPNRIFGGYHQLAADSKKCSMDLFAYVESEKLYLFQHLPKEWQLKKSSAEDIAVLRDYYEQQSGGLLLDAIGMQTNHTAHNGIEKEYKQIGLLRRLKFYTLYRYDTPCASIIVDQSNPGLNLADLLNSVKVIIMQPAFLSWTILSMAVNKLIRKHQISHPPVLIYPFDYVIVNGISYKKRYQLWLFHAAYVRQFVDFLQKKFRISYWN